MDGGFDLRGKGGTAPSLAVGTARPFALVFGGVRSWLVNIDDLSTLDRVGMHLTHVGLTMLTVRDRGQCDHLIDGFRHLQRVTSVSCLTSTLLVAFLAHAFRVLLAHTTIRGRRQRAVLTVFRLSILHLFDLLLHLFNRFQKHWSLCDVLAKPRMFFSEHASFVFCRHAFSSLPCGLGWHVSRRPD